MSGNSAEPVGPRRPTRSSSVGRDSEELLEVLSHCPTDGHHHIAPVQIQRSKDRFFIAIIKIDHSTPFGMRKYMGTQRNLHPSAVGASEVFHFKKNPFKKLTPNKGGIHISYFGPKKIRLRRALDLVFERFSAFEKKSACGGLDLSKI